MFDETLSSHHHRIKISLLLVKNLTHFEDLIIGKDDSLDDSLDIISHIVNANKNAPQPTPHVPLIYLPQDLFQIIHFFLMIF